MEIADTKALTLAVITINNIKTTTMPIISYCIQAIIL